MAGTTWRYDPAKGGVYQDDEDQQPDELAMPSAAPLTFESPSGGTTAAATPAASSVPAANPSLAAVAPFAAATEPVRLTKSSDTTMTPTPQETAATAAASAAHQQVQALTPDEIAAEKQMGEEKEFAANRQAATGMEHDWVREEANKRATAEMADLTKRATDLENTGRDRAANLKGGWQDLSNGQKIGAALAIMLSGLGQGLRKEGGPNQALGIMLNSWEKDREEKKEAIKRDYFDRAAALRGPERERVAKELDRQLGVIDRQYDIKGKNILEEFNALAARSGSEQKIVEAKKLSAEAEVKFNQDTAKQVEGLRHKHEGEISEVKPSGSGGKPSEGENKYAEYGRQMDDAIKSIASAKPLTNDELKSLQGDTSMFNATEKTAADGLGGAVLAGGGRWLGVLPRSPVESLSGNAQRVVNNIDTVVNAALRTESGAAIGEVELRRRAMQLVPTANDSPEVRAQKEVGMRRMAEDFKTLGGAATARLDAARGTAPPAAPAPAAAPGPARAATHRAPAPAAKPAAQPSGATKQLSNGKTAHMVNGRWQIQD